MTPLGALGRGIAAGVAGSAVMNLFFKATASWAPSAPKDVFEPPEKEQQGEGSTDTVARRFVESFVQRGPLSKEQKARGGRIVHYGFGAAWGYGLAAESFPTLRRPLGAAAFGTVVWVIGDEVLLPAFRLSAWPQAFPAKIHAYAWLGHLVYGASAWLTYRSITDGAVLAGAAMMAARVNRRVGRWVPKSVVKAVVPSPRTLVRNSFARSIVSALA
jgi:uncharacterized membrane protein YagU involved in acid resistance